MIPTLLLALFVALAPYPVRAQTLEEVRASLLLPRVSADQPRPSPGVTLSSPSPWGADRGVVFAGIGYQDRTRYVGRNDGAVVVGFGVGDARETMGLEVAVTSFSTYRSGILNRGSVSLRGHWAFPGGWAAAIGRENALRWERVGKSDGGKSHYLVLGKTVVRAPRTRPFSQFTVTAGAGDGRFRSEADILNRVERVGFFGALSVRVLEPVTLVADWTGQDLAVGASLTPFPRLPLVVTPAWIDLTGKAGDGTRFILGAGMAVPLSQLIP